MYECVPTQLLSITPDRTQFRLANSRAYHSRGPWPIKKFKWWQMWHRKSILRILCLHYSDIIMGAMASQITSLTIVNSTVYSGVDERKHQSSASLAIVWWIHQWPLNCPHKWPVRRKVFPFEDVIMWFPVSNPWWTFWVGYSRQSYQLMHI